MTPSLPDGFEFRNGLKRFKFGMAKLFELSVKLVVVVAYVVVGSSTSSMNLAVIFVLVVVVVVVVT